MQCGQALGLCYLVFFFMLAGPCRFVLVCVSVRLGCIAMQVCVSYFPCKVCVSCFPCEVSMAMQFYVSLCVPVRLAWQCRFVLVCAVCAFVRLVWPCRLF